MIPYSLHERDDLGMLLSMGHFLRHFLYERIFFFLKIFQEWKLIENTIESFLNFLRLSPLNQLLSSHSLHDNENEWTVYELIFISQKSSSSMSLDRILIIIFLRKYSLFSRKIYNKIIHHTWLYHMMQDLLRWPQNI